MKRATLLKTRNRALVVCAAGLVVAVNAQPATAGAGALRVLWVESRSDYRAAHGAWETVELPADLHLDVVSATLLPTGEVLIVSDAEDTAGAPTTVLWDPVTEVAAEVETPEGLLGGGQVLLPDGDLLVAGGTAHREVLAEDVVRAAGVVALVADATAARATEVVEGTVLVDESTGLAYRTTETVTVLPAAGAAEVGPVTDVWVEAVEEGPDAVLEGEVHRLRPEGQEAAGVSGRADALTLAKQENRGLDAAHVFDVEAEAYRPAADLTTGRWRPTLVPTAGGDVLAVSGLDEHGALLDQGTGTTEVLDVETGTWSARPDLGRAFPTSPSLFTGMTGEVLYSGSSAGHGPVDRMRTPGVWDLADDSFEEIPGLRDPDMTETSSSVLLPPAQDQRVLVAGGGSAGDAEGSTDRMDVVDFAARTTSPAPDLPAAARYVSSVVLPSDEVLLTGGSGDYRGRGGSDVLAATLYDAATGETTEAAPPRVGRNHRSQALLLPDGRVLTVGSSPLYGDPEGESAGTAEQRLEIYSPPYLFTSEERPVLGAAAQELELERGTTQEVPVTGDVAAARLVRPAASGQAEQRSVELGAEVVGGGVRLTVPASAALTPSGWYLLFVVGEDGTPSEGRWVRVP
ncbi:galactose oxidase-like domain-containing protein [uncultured Pseudokineococcus sp.]|uniref:galactose oxidase-like domain-containing protein n=1 Tax=uncultured Pseudokineococcus sp. TaxID=1642928 RepID=UPI00260EEA66|nr:galactose oxidase-like domain-containing protein [uncultured Pseudokineococcus sp.]